MNPTDIPAYMSHVGAAARAAAGTLAAAPTAAKDEALRALARRLRLQAPALLEANGRDLGAARSAGLAAPLLDRLAITTKIIETVAEGCDINRRHSEGDQGGERGDARDGGCDQPCGAAGETNGPRQSQIGAERCRNTLATFEFQPDRKIVTKHCAKRGPKHRVLIKKIGGQQNGNRAFTAVE